ncbi:Putative niacin/nicotinamide transporter NaiP [Paenibacillus konkukensis]|uniref:Niacin/nicotinamide transporter NaiP n=1 Tax=Paenibacillus konkukensis TaxID=2020716 RepID=A0ABY4RLM3_9BACL|nr:MFS transporter [Paenibacillus konkukensis]UQZ83286.1 Putative niacin/nicotinamide transporter NaiP [Paenibacillus konkukensis]
MLENAAAVRSSKRGRLLISMGISWLFDAMDVGIISFVVAALTVQWHLTPEQVGVFTSINSIGMVFGAAIAGYMADRFGRKSVLLWTLLIFSLASGLSALATSFAVLCLLRFIAGVGLGGELPVASTLVSETVPAEERGRTVVLLESFWAGGWLAAALVSYFIIPIYGWQAGFLIGAVPALYALYLRRSIEDPQRYMQSREADRPTVREQWASVWQAKYRRSTVMLWILWFTVVFSYYGMFLWLPTVMVMKGFGLVKGFQYVLIMTLAQLPGYFTAAYAIERFGRKFVLVLYLVFTALSAIWFGTAQTEGLLIAAGICLSFFNLGAWGGLYAYTPELYPTRVRSTGVGMATSFGRIGGVIAPLLVGLLVARGVELQMIFYLFFASILIGALAVFFLGTETKGVELED